MAAKATIVDVTDAGFRAAQFGTPADWDTADTGYLARLLKRVEAWSRGEFGDGYDDVPVTSATHERLRAAELCKVSHELWKRRAGFIDSNAVSSREGLAYLDRREFEEQAARSLVCAETNMALAKGERTPGSAVALTHVTTGPFVHGRASRCG